MCAAVMPLRLATVAMFLMMLAVVAVAPPEFKAGDAVAGDWKVKPLEFTHNESVQ